MAGLYIFEVEILTLAYIALPLTKQQYCTPLMFFKSDSHYRYTAKCLNIKHSVS